MAKYFGTDGIRARANQEPITPHTIVKIAQALGVFLKKTIPHPKVVVGKDTRVSGYIIENALAAGLQSVGADILFLGPIPTPGVAYLTKSLNAHAGIVISASHNPYYDNGIKFFDAQGFKFSDDDELELERLIDSEDFNADLVSSHDIGFAKRIDDAVVQYASFLTTFLTNESSAGLTAGSKNLNLQDKKIILDCANGASYKVAPKVFESLGAKVTALNTSPDGFNINDNCGAMHPQELQKQVLECKADIGFAFDGDADRLIVVDNTGHVVDGDQIIALCAIAMKKQNKLTNNGVCVTVMSNKGFDIAMEKAGINVVRTPVGDRAIACTMRKNGYALGGEQSGHVLFLGASTTGDGILAALKILEIMETEKKSISELVQVMTKYPQITKNVPVSHKPELSLLPKTLSQLKKHQDSLGDEGRIFLRYSGTEPVARITAEGPEHSQLEAMIKDIENLFLQELKMHSES